MYNIPQKFDGISTLPAAEFNSMVDELKNVITTTGQALSGADLNQIAKSIANYVANGTFYTDSGLANAYVLTTIGSKNSPTNYTNGLTARFKVGNSNSGASTVNVASLGVKNIKKNNGADDLDSGDLTAGNIVELTYDSVGDYFELTSTEFISSDFLRRDLTNTISVGYQFVAYSIGNSGTGTITPLIANGPFQTMTVNGNFTLAAPSETNSGVIEIIATNNGTGGYTINTAAYTIVENNYDNAASKVNVFRILKVGSTSYLAINPVPIAATVIPSNYNALMNADMTIAQRGTSFTTVADGTYTLDRYRYGKSGTVVHTITQSSTVPTLAQAGYLFQNSISLAVTTADSSIAAGDFCVIEQRIEGSNFDPIAQEAMTLSFWVRSTVTGTYCCYFKNSGADRTYVAEYVINASDTWEKKTINITASPSAGTWNYTTGIGLRVGWTLAAGSTYQTSAGSWQTGDYYATSNQVNGVNSTSNTFLLTGVQLESGSTANPFVKRNYTQKINDCMRYYQTSYPIGTAAGTATALGLRIEFTGGSALNGAAMANAELIPMRAGPTLTLYSPVTGSSGVAWNYNASADISVTAANQSERSFTVNNNTGGTITNGQPAYHYIAVSEL